MEYERGRTFNSEWGRRVTPFCSPMRDFIAQSRKCQTLYANMEGSYKRRTLRKEEHSLEEYIYNAVLYTEGCNWPSGTDSSVTQTVNLIAKKIVQVSSKYHHDEIHFCVIWVYYYNYESKSTECTPVFKIFTSKTGNTGVFINVSLDHFQSWDCYLDKAEFPESFLCVPRHGEYNFVGDEDILNLEFLCSESCLSSASHSNMKFKPYCITVVKPWLQKIKNCGKWILNKIIDFSSWLMNYLKEHKVVVCIAVGVGLVLIVAPYFCPGVSSCVDFPLDVLPKMLLNVGVQVTVQVIYALISMQKHSVPNTLPNEAGHSAVSKEGKELTSLLKKPEQKTWSRILKAFCFLYRECRPYLVTIIEASGNKNMKYLQLVLDLLDTIFKEWDNSEEEVDSTKGIAASNLPSLLDPTDGMTKALGERGPFDGSTPPQWNSSNQVGRISAEDNKVEDAEPMRLRRILKDFDYLEKHSAERFRTAVEPPRDQEMPFELNSLLIQRQNGMVIIVRAVGKESVPRWLEWLVKLLGKGVTLRLASTNVIDVLGSGGTVLGNLYIPVDGVVIGLFSEEALIVRNN